jgi:hypothetical protein
MSRDADGLNSNPLQTTLQFKSKIIRMHLNKGNQPGKISQK